METLTFPLRSLFSPRPRLSYNTVGTLPALKCSISPPSLSDHSSQENQVHGLDIFISPPLTRPSFYTLLTAVTQLADHGMIFVPLGYIFGRGVFEMHEVKGRYSYGAGMYAADGLRQPTELELQQAFYQRKYRAEITWKLKI